LPFQLLASAPRALKEKKKLGMFCFQKSYVSGYRLIDAGSAVYVVSRFS